MIQKLKNGKGAIARFGNGTVRVKAYTLMTRYGGQIELTQCSKKSIGADPGPTVTESNKIVLDFNNLEGLDVLIEKLQNLREDLANETNV